MAWRGLKVHSRPQVHELVFHRPEALAEPADLVLDVHGVLLALALRSRFAAASRAV
jgi:hypothetical protein